jgi:hypothetical protein
LLTAECPFSQFVSGCRHRLGWPLRSNDDDALPADCEHKRWMEEWVQHSALPPARREPPCERNQGNQARNRQQAEDPPERLSWWNIPDFYDGFIILARWQSQSFSVWKYLNVANPRPYYGSDYFATIEVAPRTSAL